MDSLPAASTRMMYVLFTWIVCPNSKLISSGSQSNKFLAKLPYDVMAIGKYVSKLSASMMSTFAQC